MKNDNGRFYDKSAKEMLDDFIKEPYEEPLAIRINRYDISMDPGDSAGDKTVIVKSPLLTLSEKSKERVKKFCEEWKQRKNSILGELTHPVVPKVKEDEPIYEIDINDYEVEDKTNNTRTWRDALCTYPSMEPVVMRLGIDPDSIITPEQEESLANATKVLKEVNERQIPKKTCEIYKNVLEKIKKNKLKMEEGCPEIYKDKVGDVKMFLDPRGADNCTPIYKGDIELLENIKKLKEKNKTIELSSAWDFNNIAKAICELHESKNADYGDAAYESYKDFGLVSYVIRLGDKFRRLKTLTSPGYEQQVKSESIEDTLMDLAAYAIMAIEALHKRNE